jgi:transposase
MRPKIKLADEARRIELLAALGGPPSKGLPAVRLAAVNLAYSGRHSMEEIAALVGKARSGVAKWIAKFRKGGVGALRDKPRGRKAGSFTVKVTPAAHDKLVAGLLEGRWKNSSRIRQWTEQEHGFKISKNGMYDWLRRARATVKLPRRSNVRKDPAAAREFREKIVDKLLEMSLPREKPVRVWVSDEHRFGLISNIRRVWTIIGHRPCAPYKTEYKWGYLHTALEVGGQGKCEVFFSDSVNLTMSHAFLQQISESDPGSIHVVIWDGAGFHPKADKHPELIPENIRLVRLPACSPELNPAENIGNLIKERTGNEIFDTIAAIEKAIMEVMRPLTEIPELVRSLVKEDNWLQQGVSAFLRAFSPSYV